MIRVVRFEFDENSYVTREELEGLGYNFREVTLLNPRTHEERTFLLPINLPPPHTPFQDQDE